jgi:chemotaxis protein methyltransferase CheR
VIDRIGQSRQATRTIDSAAFATTTDLLRVHAGLLFPASRHPAIEAAMFRAMRHAGVADTTTFVARLAADEAVLDDLVAEVTIGETYFFRESAHFDLLRTDILPQLLAARPGRRVRAWSAACASGEEAYSLAITLLDARVEGDVLGTDISRPRLRAAHEGVYRKWSLRGVADATVDHWFDRDGDRYAIAPKPRRYTTFGYLNLAADAYPALSTGVWGMDLILCRNVLIYFDAPTIERVSRSLLDSLSDDGWLLLGAADPPLTASMGAEVIETPAGLAYRRRHPGAKRIEMPIARIVGEPERPHLPSVAAAYEPPAPVPTAPQAPSGGGTTPAFQPATAVQPDRILAAYIGRDYESVVALTDGEQAPTSISIPHRVLHVRALANLGRLAEAGRACASALDAQRDVAELHYLHSVLLMESGRPADAAVAAKRALYLDRGMIVAQLAAATAASRSGDTAAATRALTTAERLLAALPPAAIVLASDGETAGRLLEMTRVQRRLLPA